MSAGTATGTIPNVAVRPAPRVVTRSEPQRLQRSCTNSPRLSLLTMCAIAAMVTAIIDTAQAICRIVLPGELDRDRFHLGTRLHCVQRRRRLVGSLCALVGSDAGTAQKARCHAAPPLQGAQAHVRYHLRSLA